jgi:hypothetical protein
LQKKPSLSFIKKRNKERLWTQIQAHQLFEGLKGCITSTYNFEAAKRGGRNIIESFISQIKPYNCSLSLVNIQKKD